MQVDPVSYELIKGKPYIIMLPYEGFMLARPHPWHADELVAILTPTGRNTIHSPFSVTGRLPEEKVGVRAVAVRLPDRAEFPGERQELDGPNYSFEFQLAPGKYDLIVETGPSGRKIPITVGP